MSRVPITPAQRRRLEQQLHAAQDTRLFRRTLAVLLIDQGRPVTEVADILRVSRQSVHHWLSAFLQAGRPAVLADDERPGRPRLLDDDALALLRELLRCSPQQMGFAEASWTVPRLQEALQLGTGAWFADSTVRRALRRLDYVWKRPRYRLEPDPEREKKRRIRRQIQALPPRSVLLAEDETDLLLFPPLRAGWSERGAVAEVRISGRNARRVIFGAMNLRTGNRLLLPRPKGRSGDFLAFLWQVHCHYRGWSVAMLLDEDSSHTAAASTAWAETYGIELLWLPKRSPELNPMDTLWGQGKDVISANKQYEPIEEQVERFLGFLYGLSAYEALHTSGVLSEDFWLRDLL